MAEAHEMATADGDTTLRDLAEFEVEIRGAGTRPLEANSVE